MFIDTHCHTLDKRYEEAEQEIITDYFNYGGEFLFLIGTELTDSEHYVNLAKMNSKIYAVVGFHPDNAYKMNSDTLKKLDNYAKDGETIAIGEIGLDYHNMGSDKETQKQVFINQLEIAKKYNLPVVIHSRDAIQDTIDILKQYPTVKGIMHCYSGKIENAKDLMKMGYYIGVGGTVTFKNNVHLQNIIKELGLNNVVLETDSPYLSPEPYRGKVNKPQNVLIVAEKIADLLNISTDEVLKITNLNAKKVYNLLGDENGNQ